MALDCGNTCGKTCRGYCGKSDGSASNTSTVTNCGGSCKVDEYDYNACTKHCASNCQDACDGKCKSDCEGNCSGCDGTCTGSCDGGCKGSCEDTCNYACINEAQTDNIKALLLDDKLKAQDIKNMMTAMKFEIITRRGKKMIYSNDVNQKERIDDEKINLILSNLSVLSQQTSNSASLSQKALKILAQEAIDKINIAYNEIVPMA